MSTYEHIEVHKVGGNLGAVVDGVRIGGELAPELVAELCSALLAHRVVFLRGQDHADDDDQRAFAELLGTITKPQTSVVRKGDASFYSPLPEPAGVA